MMYAAESEGCRSAMCVDTLYTERASGDRSRDTNSGRLRWFVTRSRGDSGPARGMTLVVRTALRTSMTMAVTSLARAFRQIGT